MSSDPIVRALRDDEVGAWLRVRNAAFGSAADPGDPEVAKAVAWRVPYIRVVEAEGRLAAAATWYPYPAWIGGALVPTGALASVATAPEARRRGHVRALLRAGFEELHEAGVGWSGEHPFDPRFYDAFGYRRVPSSVVLELPFDRLPGRARDVDAVPVAPDDPDLRAIRRAFASRRSFTLDRDTPEGLGAHADGMPARWRDLFEAPSATASPVHAYRCEGGYAIVATEGFGTDGVLHVVDAAWTDPAGRARVLALLTAWDGQTGRVRLELPTDDPLARRDADERSRPRTPLQMRIVDVKAALTPLRAPEPAAGTLILELRDASAPWNDGRWRVTVAPDGCTVDPTRETPDVTLDVGALVALLAGTTPAALIASGEAEGSAGAMHRLHALTLDHPPFLGLADHF
ncbi:enhanced intracellular survival protein Eis [uncultured Demequina sp.]|uniref:GNAT family N-acetyltransferase n=1 Tax=uncultured Demequina sp. TaxID=693499 RepID=UPI0025E4E626|nr:GNAT family N-acetyltransferase [uncultured Demequina sp.]